MPRLSEEQMAQLEKNPFVIKVTSEKIFYSEEFKRGRIRFRKKADGDFQRGRLRSKDARRQKDRACERKMEKDFREYGVFQEAEGRAQIEVAGGRSCKDKDTAPPQQAGVRRISENSRT